MSDTTELRSCTDCGWTAPREQFPAAPGTKARAAGKRRRRCEPCWRAVRRVRYATLDKPRAYEWRYGITMAQRDEMLAAQGGVCRICKSPDPGAKGEWCTDHDHACCPQKSRSCGECIRGILCFGCNVMLGCAKDDIATLQNAILYLNQSNVSRMRPAQG